jgi:integrase
MTEQAIYNLVTEYASAAGLGNVSPNDLRLTFATLAHKGGSTLDQIQLSLGHGSIRVTQRDLGIAQDLKNAPGDHLGLRL